MRINITQARNNGLNIEMDTDSRTDEEYLIIEPVNGRPIITSETFDKIIEMVRRDSELPNSAVVPEVEIFVDALYDAAMWKSLLPYVIRDSQA